MTRADLRTIEFGSPGKLRSALTNLVRDGAKVAGFVHPADFHEPGETEFAVGEELRVLDDDGSQAALVRVRECQWVRFDQVTWSMVEAEGEGDHSVQDWRQSHAAYWREAERPISDEQLLFWYRFDLLTPTPLVPRPTAGDLGLPDGYRHLTSGKVRDLFASPEGDLILIASDRISAFDYILANTIPDKGAILTSLSHWWFGQVRDIVGNHLVAGPLPASITNRAMRARQLTMLPVEAVVRGYLTGSGLVDYLKTGQVCGHRLPAGLRDGDELPQPLFTPATKAAIGDHDENVDFAHVVQAVGQADAEAVRDLSLAVYDRARDLARDRGVLLADTKFEFGRDGGGPLLLADEVLTPDSSRFWPADQWQPGRPQPSFDKQFVRNWLLSPQSGWSKDSGEPPPLLPEHIVGQTRERYLEAYRRLTGTEWAPGQRLD